MKKLIILAVTAISFISCQTAKQNPAENESTIAQTPTVQDLNQNDLSNKIAEDNVVLIDVRTPGEISEGYIAGAAHFIDFYSDGFQNEIKKLDKDKTYVVYCRSGGRSGKAAKFMVENGFNTVFNLNGGISDYNGDVAK
jgi:rhodanese-related sulfurtransferase